MVGVIGGAGRLLASAALLIDGLLVMVLRLGVLVLLLLALVLLLLLGVAGVRRLG
jgi:hypothetical protein